ncbi:ATP-binding protein [Nocardiopsis sp. CNR-923]|uniref:ATP-binding protein n=1 Tax=Nocardiopsis sp. CNR-923 TaxID=1904965 RepID=UPI000AC3BBFA|nr:ATP-binding protein [Nocardiopsis sp. CNR-923]
MPTVASTVIAPTGIDDPGTGPTPAEGGDPRPRRLSRRLPHTPTAARGARTAVGDFLRGLGQEILQDAAHLVVTELVANAVRHGRPPVDLILTWLDGRAGRTGLRVEVLDRGTAASPGLGAGFGDDQAEGGRGLTLVQACCDRWGFSPGTDAGTHVWAELERPRADG